MTANKVISSQWRHGKQAKLDRDSNPSLLYAKLKSISKALRMNIQMTKEKQAPAFIELYKYINILWELPKTSV